MKFVIEAFENELSNALEVNKLHKSIVATSNGWSALYAALLAIDISPGDEIVTTPFTFQATTNAIIAAGGKPVFVDINEDDHLINTDKIEEAITEKTKAILPVHLFGRPCRMEKILKLAQSFGLYVIEDAAQAFLSKYNGKHLGTFGDFGCFSFYCTKNLSTFEGGAIYSRKFEEKELRSIISYGRDELGNFETFGFNGRMSPQAALVGYERLKLHKRHIINGLGEYNELNGFYPYVTYQHPFMRKLGITGNCPIAERVACQIKKS